MKTRIIGWLAAALLGIPMSVNATGSSCPVSAPPNGNLGTCPSSLLSGTSCTVSCNAGFTVTGNATSCLDGTLTQTQTCAANPCVVTAPANGGLGTCPSVLPSGTSCTVSCNAGFTLTGAATSCTNGALSKTQSCVITPPPDGGAAGDGPLPLWAIGALGAGLFGTAWRRLRKAA